jgi:signal transduction histidine kinase
MKISVMIFAGFTLILLFFAATTYVNYQQSQQVKENSEWVSTSQLVIRLINRYQRNVIDMQSNLRGFLLTGEDNFLRVYAAADSENVVLRGEILQKMDPLSYQFRQMHGIDSMRQVWKSEYAQPLIKSRVRVNWSDSTGAAFRQLYADPQKRAFDRRLNEQIQASFREVTNAEYELREVRRANLNDSEASTRGISFALTALSIGLGLSVAFYISYTLSHRINNMVHLADRITSGKFDTLLNDTARDELGHLSRSLNRMSRMLDEYISELERKNQELDRFGYVVSHDLKAPLRGIENISRWIEEDFTDELPGKMLEYTELIRNRIRRMEGLIDGLLALSRIGRQKQPAERVDVGQMLTEIVELLSPGPGMRVLIPARLPVVYTEKLPLQQVLTNLISNAVKYHHRSDGEIRVGFRELDYAYEFSVTDDGPGIDPQYHEKIFIIFQTLRPKDAFESSGVGLAIVKKILDDRKCSIRVVSNVGKGASFLFTWPKTGNLVANA